MRVAGKINRRPVEMVVDTGSELTFIRKDLIVSCGIPKAGQKLCGVTGDCIPMRGPVWVSLNVGDVIERLPVFVAEMEDPCLLGLDYLARVDLQRRRMTVRGHEVPLILGEHALVAQVKPKQGRKQQNVNKQHTRDKAMCAVTRLTYPTTTSFHLATQDTLQSQGKEAKLVVQREVIPSHLEDLVQRSIKHLTSEQARKVRRLLNQYADVFSQGDMDLGRTSMVKHHIYTRDTPPIKQPHRRVPPAKREEMQCAVQEMAKAGIIERSNRNWCSPVVLVTKDGNKRFCVDYRALNAVTVTDAYPLPRIDDTLDALSKGLWHFNVMPFGLCNAPGCFERLMEQVLEGLQWKVALVYLDDILVFGNTFEEELEHLTEVLCRFKAANLKLSPKKCTLFHTEVPFLGHVVGRQGVRTDPLKVSAVESWPVPRTVAELRSFLGLCTYYRRFVQGFATIAAPLHQLTRKGASFVWDEACHQAFVALKQALELAAVVKGLSNFHHYLYGAQFTIRTDHAALRWLKTLKEPEGQLARWLGKLEQYNYQVVHRAGRVHSNADSLSRRPCEPDCNHCFHRESEITCRRLVVSESIAEADKRWREDQQKDQDLAPVIQWLEAGKKRPQWEAVSLESPATKFLVDQWEALRLENGILQRSCMDAATGKQQWLIVAPLSRREGLLKEVHNGKTSGHLGIKRTMEKLRWRVYWVGLRQDVQEWCRTCQVCAAKKGPAQKTRAPLQLYQAGAPMERMAVDIAGPFPCTERGNKYICVAMDYFSKWPEAGALPNHEADTVAEFLVTQVFTRFGVPGSVVVSLGSHKTRTTPLRPQSDGMVERFSATLVTQLAKYCEEDQHDWNELLPYMLMAYRASEHEANGFTPSCLMFGREIRLPVDLATGKPPGEGLPVPHTEYVRTLQRRMEETRHRASQHLKIAGQAMGRRYNERARDAVYSHGDQVWFHNPHKRPGKSPKLRGSHL
ncbi:hypothetical protein C7M84_016621 [Penaeus vannamei]|uniref:RNA-directed DNA polymerase n=1 Tax=Penaeus vannamei TaxID=6689 RepID=A0A423SMD0_PENVA|nr:hypothetical protein C7M84_016621 [Penaeus vannamei]